MNYKIIPANPFEKEIRILLKKYPSLKSEIRALGIQLSENPMVGIALGNDCYKIRLAIASKGKGKSGGARVITHVHVEGTLVYLISIFDKSEQASITDQQIFKLLELIER